MRNCLAAWLVLRPPRPPPIQNSLLVVYILGQLTGLSPQLDASYTILHKLSKIMSEVNEFSSIFMHTLHNL